MASEIKLSNGMICLVDDWNYALLAAYRWTASPANQYKRYKGDTIWYAARWERRDGKKVKVYMHRFIAKTRRGHVCNHLNFNTLDNREENLQNCTQSTNMKHAHAGVDRSDEW